MDTIPLGMLFSLLALSILLSACFSGSETALMSVNRYRLKHRADKGHRGARFAVSLLARPDRLIALILLGNNIVNVAASMLTTIIVLRLYPNDESMLAIAGGILTMIILIFAEVAPKTLATTHPEGVAYPASMIYLPLLKLLFPLVWLTNLAANTVLKLLGTSQSNNRHDQLNLEELETVVNEASALIPQQHQDMLSSILGLERITVEDIMVPRNEISGIDLQENLDEIVIQLHRINKTRIPVYRESIDKIVGMLHIKKMVGTLLNEEVSKEKIETLLLEPVFIPEGTALMQQLLNFRQNKHRIGLVVDEYGDIIGLVTLEDILEEIVGEFTTGTAAHNKDIVQQAKGIYLVDGGIHIRDINRTLDLSLPTNGPKTLNGLILEHMEMIPEAGTSMLITGYAFEVVKTVNNSIKTLRLNINEDITEQHG